MKKIFFIVIISLLFACNKDTNIENKITLTVKKGNYFPYPVANPYLAIIKNNSNSTVYIWMRNRYYLENFTSNNKKIHFTESEYPKSVPVVVSIKPLEEKKFEIPLMFECCEPFLKFKIGFYLINDLDEDSMTLKEYQKRIINKDKNSKIIWSNEVDSRSE